MDSWTEAAQITTGRVFRSINKAGKVGMTPKVIWEIVKDAAARSGIEKLAPHDVRRTCARLCHLAGGEWIRFNSYSGMFRYRPLSYVGCRQKLPIAVNDNLGIELVETL